VISHDLKCIFVHIPRTAGSSIEKWLCGEDWWSIEAETKHLSAHLARQRYRRYWDSYFKFSFVRNPWDRMVSCLRFGEHFGVSMKNGHISCLNYDNIFGGTRVLELDHRYYSPSANLRPVHTEGSVYLNLLDEKVDFVGRYESLDEDCAVIASHLGVDPLPDVVEVQSGDRTCYQDYYDEAGVAWVAERFARDIEFFDYAF